MNGLFSLDALDDEALDHLPFGVVRLDPTGRIERFNQPEADRSGIAKWRAKGRDYFRDIAGNDLAEAIASLPPGQCTTVDTTFKGFHRNDHAVVDASRSPEGKVYLRIRRAA